MNLADVVVIIAVAALLLLAVRLYRGRKNSSCCGTGCDKCGRGCCAEKSGKEKQ